MQIGIGLHNVSAIAERRGVRQFVKFGIVGASGLVVNAIIAHLLKHYTTLSGFTDFAIGFMSGGVSNYVLNRIWTFRSTRPPLIEGLQFLTVSLISLGIGKAIFVLADHFNFNHFTITWFLATLGGIFVNFFLNKYWTFKHAS
jgi:dolichol-phosphate mannosyltransferase